MSSVGVHEASEVQQRFECSSGFYLGQLYEASAGIIKHRHADDSRIPGLLSENDAKRKKSAILEIDIIGLK